MLDSRNLAHIFSCISVDFAEEARVNGFRKSKIVWKSYMDASSPYHETTTTINTWMAFPVYTATGGIDFGIKSKTLRVFGIAYAGAKIFQGSHKTNTNLSRNPRPTVRYRGRPTRMAPGLASPWLRGGPQFISCWDSD